MKRIIIIVGLIWSVSVGASFIWNYRNAETAKKTIAFQTARSFFASVLVSRAWNAEHGGVYVPVIQKTQPNPYLNDPLRDIQVSDDLTLTKVNPAFMTRQIAEIAAQKKGVQFHITSLKPIRPENRPTLREEKALEAFEKGIHEIGEVVESESDSSFFYMAPLKIERACLKCHASQGYREGDIRGGISVTLPFIPKLPLMVLVQSHIVIGLLGVVVIIAFGKRLHESHKEIKRQAVSDALTGIPNRRSFSERIFTEYSRSRREKRPLSVILGDIDNFKSYNDTYGHNAGDKCLKKVANRIQATLKRPGDFCARYGGEEFIVILPNTGEEGAVLIAEEIRSNIVNMKIPYDISLPLKTVTMSFGVATLDVDESVSHEELIIRSDKALYEAKEKGRNRVEVSGKQPSLPRVSPDRC